MGNKQSSSNNRTNSRSSRRGKENKAMNTNTDDLNISTRNQRTKKRDNKSQAQEEPSLISFANKSSERTKRRKSFGSIIITDALTDVRKNYHINPKEIGHGHYGVVRKCMDRRTNEWYAIKSILKSKVNRIEILKREIEILAQVDHQNIIKLIEVYEDVKYLHLITELCTGGELFDRIIDKSESPEGHFDEKHAAKLIASILDAIAYCHDRQIVHRDLKPENFLFVSGDDNAPIKIIDFGLSRHEAAANDVMRTKVGTPYYVAPEVLRKNYTKSCDIWSIGVIAYILLCGYPPFYGDSDNEIFDSVKAGKFDFPSPEWDTISDDAKDFVCCLLKMNPSDRLTAHQALQHKWIREQKRRRNSTINLDSARSERFKNFMGLNKLKKVALGYIATYLTEEEVQCLTEIFEKLDDGSGKLPIHKLCEALAATENYHLNLRKKMSRLRQDLSLTGDESIVWKEFLSAMADKSLLIKEQRIRMAFNLFRKSNSRGVKVVDLITVFGGEAGAEEIIHMDQLGDREMITCDEFRTMMTDSFTDSDDESDI